MRFVLTDYIERALAQSEFDKLADGTFAGRISLSPGVLAFAQSLGDCQRELRSVLEDWIWLGLRLGHPLPVIDDIDLNTEPTCGPVGSL